MSKKQKTIVAGTLTAALVASSLTPAVTVDAATKTSKQMKLVMDAHKNLMLYGSNNPKKASFDLRKDVAVNKDIYYKWKKSNDYKVFFENWNKLTSSEKKTKEMKKVKAEYQAAKVYLETTNTVFAYYNEAIKLAEKIIKDPTVESKIVKLETKAKKGITSLKKQVGSNSKRVTYVMKKAGTVSVFVTASKEFKAAKTKEDAKKALEKMKKETGNYSSTFVKIATARYKEILPKLPVGNDTFDLSVLHTNDTHAWVENMPKLVTAVKEERKKKPNAQLIHAGDVFSGTLYFNEFKGQADLKLLNLMNYNFMTFGNHEFDLGSTPEGHKALADFVKGAKFPFVSSNVDFSADSNLKDLQKKTITTNAKNGQIYNGVVKEINGEKVGFLGLTTEETINIASVGSVKFANYIKSAQATVDKFEDMGINKIVAVTHIGYDDSALVDNDLQLAANVDGIDLIVGGHSHTKLEKETVVDTDAKGKKKDPTVIVQAYQYADFLGTVDVKFNKDGKVIGHSAKLIETKDLTADKEATEVLKEYKEKVDSISQEKIGVKNQKMLDNPRDNNDTSKPSVRKNETELGNLITDGMLEKAKQYDKNVVMAFQNGGGIRTSLPAGDLTTGDIIKILPFGNTLATMELKGSEIKAALEKSVSLFPVENGGFLHISGAKVTFDSSRPAGNRVTSINFVAKNGVETALVSDKTYVVATNAFTAKGGDGYDMLKKAYDEGRATDLGLSDWENLREHILKLGKIDVKIEGRVIDVKGTITNPDPNPNPNPDPSPNPDTIVVTPGEFNGTELTPKVFHSNVKVDISNISLLNYATVNGNLILTGTPKDDFMATKIIVLGDLDLTSLQGKKINLNNFEVKGETKL